MARPGLDKHPKFRVLVRMLREPRPHVLGYLEMLWSVGYECGDAIIGDAEAIEAAAEYPGDPGKLFKALLTCGGDKSGFIEEIPQRPGVYQIHDLMDHAPEYVKKRQKREQERKSNGIGENGGQRRTLAENGAPPGTRHPAPGTQHPAPINTGAGGAGVCANKKPEEKPAKKPSPASGDRPSVFSEVTVATLRSPAKLDAWWRMASAQKPKPVISGCEADRLRVHAAAERVLNTKCGSACAVFVSIISGQKWDRLTGEWDDRGQARIKELDAAARDGP